MKNAMRRNGRRLGMAALLASVWLLAAAGDAQAGGTAQTCGENAYGQLGLGHLMDENLFQTVGSPTDTAAAACGGNHSLALTQDGHAYSCGDNTDGQLGLGHNADRSTFTLITTLSQVVGVAGGYSHSLLAGADGFCYATGYNGYGQLGQADNTSRNSFTVVQGLPGLNTGSRTPVACGDNHSVVIDNTGHVWTCGYNGLGQLGLGPNDFTDRDTFEMVPNLGPPYTPPIVEISCGANYTFALDALGTLYAAGSNVHGQLGYAYSDYYPEFAVIATHVVLMATGGYHSLIETDDGIVWVTGCDGYGQLGLGDSGEVNDRYGYTSLTSFSNNIRNVDALGAGGYHSFAVLSSGVEPGTVWASGDNYYGQLGVGDNTERDSFTPAVGISGVSFIDGGYSHSLGLNSAATTLQMANGAVSVAEDVGSAALTVTLTPASADIVTVAYSVTGGTAVSGTDYTLAPGVLTFLPGQTSRSFVVTILDNLLSQDNRRLDISLSSPSNAQLGSPSVTSLTIVDDDPLPTVAFAAAAMSSPENVPNPPIQVQLSAPAGRAIQVTCKAAGGTAVAGTDYALTSTTLTFPAGQVTALVPITVIDNAVSNVSKTVLLSLSAPKNATLGAPSTHTLTIADNEPPAVQFAAATSAVSESAGTTTLKVLLTRAFDKVVTVKYAATGGTATGNSVDYLMAPGTLTFAVGETSKDVSVNITNGINKPEPDETVIIGLSGVTNALPGIPQTHALTILDNSPPVLSVESSGDIDFGNVGVGVQKIIQSVYTVKNLGGGTLRAKVSVSDPPFHVLDAKGLPVFEAQFTISSGTPKKIALSCVPYALGPVSRTITFSVDGTSVSTTRNAKCVGVIQTSITTCPTSVLKGTTVNIAWAVEGGAPTHNDIHWATSLAALAASPNKTDQDLTAPYSSWFRAPATAGTVYIQSHAIISGKAYLSPVKTITVK